MEKRKPSQANPVFLFSATQVAAALSISVRHFYVILPALLDAGLKRIVLPSPRGGRSTVRFHVKSLAALCDRAARREEPLYKPDAERSASVAPTSFH